MAEPRKIAELQLRLKGFVEPDTAAQYEGWLEPGKYVVLEHRPNHPNPDTDYTRLLAPGLGASDTWVCSRWKDQVYQGDHTPIAHRNRRVANLVNAPELRRRSQGHFVAALLNPT